MNQNVVIELSSFNSKELTSNSEWSNSFPVTQINTGDSITLKNAFIDTKNANNYGDIILTKDYNLTLEYGYYYIFADGDNKTETPGGLPADMEPYIAREEDNTLVTGKKEIVVPQGKYTPEALGEFITRELTTVKHQSQRQFIDNDNDFLTSSTNSYQVNLKPNHDIPGGTTITTFYSTAGSLSPGEVAQYTAEGGADVVIYYINMQAYTVDRIIHSVNAETGEIVVTVGIDFPVTSEFVDAYIALKDPVTRRLCNPFDNDIYFTFDADNFIGASQVSLVYNPAPEQTQKFAWTYMHTPLYENDPPIEVVGWQDDGAGNYRMVDSESGIFWTTLESEPANFFEDILGFSQTDMIVVENVETHLLASPLVRSQNITSNLFSLTDVFNHANTLKVPTGPFYTASNSTQYIETKTNYQSTEDGGYFLIEISNLTTEYEANTMRHNIMAIVSRQYDNLGFISFFPGAGSLQYINTGQPFNLASLKVRILDPKTKQPLSDASLGNGNSIFLELRRAEPQQTKK